MFRLMIEENVIPIDKKLLKIKRLKDIKLNLQDMDKIKKENISISEIIVNELNFQNLTQIKQLCSIIEFDKHFDSITNNIKEDNFGFTKEESDKATLESMKRNTEELEWLKKQKEESKNPFDDAEITKTFFKSIIRNLYRYLEPNKEKSFSNLYR